MPSLQEKRFPKEDNAKFRFNQRPNRARGRSALGQLKEHTGETCNMDSNWEVMKETDAQ